MPKNLLLEVIKEMLDESIVGKRFGRLRVVEFSHIKNRASYWKCICDCGNEKIIYRGALTSGDTISCGCFHKEHNAEYGFKHGKTNTKLYSVWSGMIQRCTNCKASNYKRYGGRGIRVYDEWRENFISFHDWAMENGYEEGLSLDRINNEGNYEPSNCRWVTIKQQQNNMRTNHVVEYNGIKHTIAEWARILNVNHETLRYRINHNNFSDFESLPYAKEFLIN